jgi:hypothetical protein
MKVSKYKTFGGIVYHHDATKLFEKQANEWAQRIKDQGGAARVIKGNCGGKDCWRIYTRKPN